MTVSTQNAPALTQEDVTDILLDVAFLPCPHCRSAESVITPAKVKRKNSTEHGTKMVFIEIPMLCANRHDWIFRVANMGAETAVHCRREGLI